jgi:hypothetical protein
MSWRHETNARTAHWIPDEESTLSLCGREVYGGPAPDSAPRCQQCFNLLDLETRG